MSIHVPTDLEESIRKKVESGQYDDPSAVMRAAIRLLDKRDPRLRELRTSIAEGLAALERGEGSELTPELMAKIDQEADEQIRLGLSPDPESARNLRFVLAPTARSDLRDILIYTEQQCGKAQHGGADRSHPSRPS